MDATPAANMFGPPICRGMRTLDRAFFRKSIPLKAARVLDNKNISRIRSELTRSRDIFRLERLQNVHVDPDSEKAKAGKKCIILRPEVRTEVDESAPPAASGEEPLPVGAPWPHSSTLTELVDQQLISIIPYTVNLDYSYWTYHDLISAILPENELDEIPSGFSQVGHVAHLNLREEYLPYKDIIAEIIVDKNAAVKTVINKIDDVGEESEYRTFRYEVLAGPDDLNVEVTEELCSYRFDYSKVYWNSRLQTEHTRIVSMFKEGEAVCDVMAGVGPFAIPAGKARVFMWANDLNPDAFAAMQDAVVRNKVKDFVRPFNLDGRQFIRSAVLELLDTDYWVKFRSKSAPKPAGSAAYVPFGGSPRAANQRSPSPVRYLQRPKTFQHFLLNLPASALGFLPNFIGLYPSELRMKVTLHGPMPIIHVYCFSTKDELEEDDPAAIKICAEISKQLGHEMKLGKVDEGGVEVYDVRDVAPKKRMFCASFRLPEEVAFRDS